MLGERCQKVLEGCAALDGRRLRLLRFSLGEGVPRAGVGRRVVLEVWRQYHPRLVAHRQVALVSLLGFYTVRIPVVDHAVFVHIVN